MSIQKTAFINGGKQDQMLAIQGGPLRRRNLRPQGVARLFSSPPFAAAGGRTCLSVSAAALALFGASDMSDFPYKI
jgi:hypothetical protein